MQEVIELLRKFRDERDWGRFHNPKDLAISISVEVAELLEVFQWTPGGQDISGDDRGRVASEAADVLIYLLLLFDRLDLNPESEVRKKMQFNELRFPINETFGKPGGKA